MWLCCGYRGEGLPEPLLEFVFVVVVIVHHGFFLGGEGISFYFLATPTAYRILVPQPRIEPAPLALEALSLNHWTIREVSGILKNWAARSS